MIFTGKRSEKPDYITLSEEFFGGQECGIDAKIYVCSILSITYILSDIRFELLSYIYCDTPIEIALGIDKDGMTTARKLYEFLELAKGQFSRWAKTNILENPFAEENVDFEVLDSKSKRAQW